MHPKQKKQTICFFQPQVPSWMEFLILVLVASFLVFICDFYAESIGLSHLNHTTAARWCPILLFLSAFVISHLWFAPYRTASAIDLIHGHGMESVEHGLSGGVVFTLLLFPIGLSAPHSFWQWCYCVSLVRSSQLHIDGT